MFSSFLMGRSIIKISAVSLHYHFLCIIPLDISQVSFLISMKRTLLSDCAFWVYKGSHTFSRVPETKELLFTFRPTLCTNILFLVPRKLVREDVVCQVQGCGVCSRLSCTRALTHGNLLFDEAWGSDNWVWPFSTEIIKRAWGFFIKFHLFVTGDIQLQLWEVLSSGGYLHWCY